MLLYFINYKRNKKLITSMKDQVNHCRVYTVLDVK